jgi:pyruvate kinase
MRRRTKIVCTLGPAVNSREAIKALIDAGMNVARINCSHGDWETRRMWVRWIRELSPEIGPVAVLVDLQGPKFRIGSLPTMGLEVHAGQTVEVGPSPAAAIRIEQPEILNAMEPGDRLLLGDGEVELKLGAREAEDFAAKVLTGGTVKGKQGVTLVGKVFDVPCLTEKDLADLPEACAVGADIVALSYVRTASDIKRLRAEVDKLDPRIRLCAKIETRSALKEIGSIIDVSDVIMVARGDMGLQMDIEDVPPAQKEIIHRCQIAGKPVITATQMLESMVHNARPTRAEATDVANAILDGTDAVMLSGETAAGAYPVEAVNYMARIAEKAEKLYDHARCLRSFAERCCGHVDSTEAVAYAVAHLEVITKPRAILTTSTSGQTPRLVAQFRPKAPIWCATWNEKTYRQMAVVWGVEAVKIPELQSADEITEAVISVFLKKKRLKVGDVVIITAGVPVGQAGTTNLILTETVKQP